MNTGYTEAGNRRATGPWQGSFISQAHFINKSTQCASQKPRCNTEEHFQTHQRAHRIHRQSGKNDSNVY